MKLKIVHQNQENRVEEHLMETEDLVTEEPQIREDDSSKEDSPAPASHPMLLSGKRKRKPKKMIDDVSPIILKTKKKKSSSSTRNIFRSNIPMKMGTPDRGGASMSKGDVIVGGSVTPLRVKSPTLLRAEHVQMSLSNDLPSVMKVLVRSHVGSCFWMGLPVPFCKMHLPSKDTEVVLEDESGEKFPIKYIANKSGLSAGWRKFVAANKLVEGDVLIFQLVEPCRFKVYVIRTNDLTDVDGALSLLILDSKTTQKESACLHKLLSMAYDSESSMDVRRYVEACRGKIRTDDEICKLEAKLVELKELSGEYAVDAENLQGKAESYKVMFQEEVDQPW